mmetsp:Transcript_8510/g.35512  ORF Transcript_8510/g.35512 Transcript_8510/m.35512 type:complete len:418 (-) Transcript_8510:108-1361(-)|eukprot:CAMPEP_0114625040 /NCGR_PEP_ID=MMETSP0168-20121206/11070_1 /TAXON_ID=95228 ORGANISM="Vannella sp., Strain DIVA3 517/6/12" /NCGR_SAMPLE_ID=MMETSP0168 /ASSEMBLY_ACC=CAM_ASM_000044 /LENGTH=417 /DNA_ID=CAMNT_0001836319 /DNA_START=38 /DNA_END=1291 /DNA_ORIENTATION=+
MASKDEKREQAAALLQQIAEEVKCALCLDLFQAPRVLECQHTFCTECLYRILYNHYSDRERIMCPLCRHVTQLSVAGGIDTLPRNVNLTAIASAIARCEGVDAPLSSATPQSPMARTPSPALLEFPPQGSGVDYSFQHVAGSYEQSVAFSTHTMPMQQSAMHHQQNTKSLMCALLEVDHDRAMAEFKVWLKSLWFAPSKLHQKLEDEGPFYLQLRYIPFYTFDVSVETSYTATIACTTLPASRDRISDSGIMREVPRHLQCSGTHNKVYSHILACAALDEDVRKMAEKVTWDVDNILTGPPPVQLDDSMPWYQAWRAAHVMPSVLSAETKECSQIVLDEEAPARILSIEPSMTFRDIQHSLIYLPLYVSTYQHGGKKFKFVVSGQTGEICGERPYGIGQAGAMLSTVKKWFSGSSVH